MNATDQRDSLIQYVNSSLEDEEQFHFLRFEFLHRLNIVDLEVKLARMKSQIKRSESTSQADLDTLDKTLRSYACAIRDYEYLKQHKSLNKIDSRDRKQRLRHYFETPDDFGDPYQSHYSWFHTSHHQIDPIRRAFMKNLPSRLAYSHREKQERKKEYLDGKEPTEVSVFVDRLVRLVIALAGGLFLVVPVHIMSFGPSLIKSLITVSVSVALFALVVSLLVRVTNIETLVSTATYAAVLVVFLGSTTQ